MAETVLLPTRQEIQEKCEEFRGDIGVYPNSIHMSGRTLEMLLNFLPSVMNDVQLQVPVFNPPVVSKVLGMWYVQRDDLPAGEVQVGIYYRVLEPKR